jgi:prepilin-type N-terminal cleavage/methylation domain-containing protein
MRTINSKAFSKAQKGFTLIEMAVVITIVGFMIASIASAFVQWQTWQRTETTNQNIQTAQTAIEQFLNQFGRYPCPASLQATRTNGTTSYGTEPPATLDCETPLAAGGHNTDGIAGDDIFVVAGSRDEDGDLTPDTNFPFLLPGSGTPTTGQPTVRIGTIPFRMLGLDESEAYDGYRNRLFYAVTEHLASAISFESNTGAINILDTGNNSYTITPGSNHYVIFSAGENGLGAFNREGTRIPCPADGTEENKNCDFDDADFVFDDYNASNSNQHLDDVMAFGLSEAPKWQRPQGEDFNDGVLYKDLGFGPTASNDPEEELDVSGVIRVRDDPSTPDYEEGKVRANTFCSFGDPADPDCFDVSSIAGAIDDGEGMECPNANEFITGISNNAPNCEVVRIGCPGNRIVVGINSNGTLNCGEPPESCPTQQVVLCSGESAETTETLPTSSSGTDIILTAGTNTGNEYTQEWTCNDGTWEMENSYGLCECNASSSNFRYNVSCADESERDCGRRWEGTQDLETRTVCPSGDTVVDYVTRDDCSCIETESVNNWSCGVSWINSWVLNDPAPDGYRYNTGEVEAFNQHVCPGEYCSGWQERSSDCGCVNEAPWIDSRSCRNGVPAPAEEYVTYQFVCDGGEGPGQYGQVQEISVDDSACVCDEGVTNGPVRDCTDGRIPRDGYSGVPTLITTSWDGSSCTTSTADAGPETDYCMEPPPLRCYLEDVSPLPGVNAVLPRGSQCDCPENQDDARDLTPCRVGNSSFNCRCTAGG